MFFKAQPSGRARLPPGQALRGVGVGGVVRGPFGTAPKPRPERGIFRVILRLKRFVQDVVLL